MKNKDDKELFDVRLKLSEYLKQVIESIEVYTRVVIRDSSYIEMIRNKLGDDAASIMQKSIQQSEKITLPFYIVNYKSGEKRIINTNSKNPVDLQVSFKWDSENILDTNMKWLYKT